MHCYSELLITPVKNKFLDVIKDQKLKAAFNNEVRWRKYCTATPLHPHRVMAPLRQAPTAMQQQQHACWYQVPKNNIHIAYVHVTILISPIKAAVHITKTT